MATGLPRVDFTHYLQHCALLSEQKILTAHEFRVAFFFARKARLRGRTGETGPLAYALIAKAAGCCKQTAVECVARLLGLGLLDRKMASVVVVRPNGGAVCRQLANQYRLIPTHLESRRPTDSWRKKVSYIVHRAADAVSQDVKAAREAMDRISAARREFVAANWRKGLGRFRPG